MIESVSKKHPGFVHLLMINTMLYISFALFTPFLSSFYRQQGLTSSQIGILQTINPLSFILIQPLWARRSDQSGHAKNYAIIIIVGMMISLYSFYLGSGFLNYLFSCFLLSIFYTSINPLLDAIVVRNAHKANYNFAYIRMGGTIGYAIVVLGIGMYLREQPSSMFLIASFSYLILLILLILLPASENQLPSLYTGKPPKRPHLSVSSITNLFDDKGILYVLLFAFLFQVGASFLSGFLGVFAIELGYGQGEIGLLSFVQAVSEIPVLLLMNKLTKKFGGLHLVFAAAFLMGVRLLVASGGSLTFLILAQAMQGITFMVVHLGAITFIAEHVKEGHSSEGQSVLYMIQSGLAAIIGSSCGGFVIDAVGIRNAYGLIGALVILASLIAGYFLFVHGRNKVVSE